MPHLQVGTQLTELRVPPHLSDLWAENSSERSDIFLSERSFDNKRDITCQETSNLIRPPLDTHHDHAGDGQADVGAPILQALFGPACVVNQ